MSASVVVIPHAARGALHDARLRRRLSRGDIALEWPPAEAFAKALEALGAPAPAAGLAALRYLADAGRGPAGWVAAADPVHFETRLRHLVVRSLAVTEEELRTVFATLQAELGDACEFECVGTRGYVRANPAFATVPVSVDAAAGGAPDAIPAQGGDAARLHRLLGEIQMILHDHPVNQRRADAGEAVLNSLWLWGGGELPAATQWRLPRLCGRDPLFAGYWLLNGGELAPGSAAGPAALAGREPFVCVTDDATAGAELALRAARRGPVSVVARDGLTAALGPFDRFRIWRRTAPEIAAPAGDV